MNNSDYLYFYRYFEAEYDDLMERLDPLIDKIYELYITEKKRYVVLNNNGLYHTVIWHYNKELNLYGAKPIKRFMLESHLKGWKTLCVFASEYTTKFICFDVDIKGNERKKKAQKAVRLLFNTLVEYGIPKEKIYTSWSGSKGYHVEVFFDFGLSNGLAKEFFELIVNRPGLNDIYNGKIEFLPTSTRAIKLPLGQNFCNRIKKNRLCCFVDINSKKDFVNITSDHYFLDIQKIDPTIIKNALVKNGDMNDLDGCCLSNRNSLSRTSSNTAEYKIVDKKGLDLPTCKIEPKPQNKDYSIDSILELEREGLKQPGTRHDALLKLSILYKCNKNYSQEETKEKLIEWMRKQDKSSYTTSLEESIKDIEKIVDYTYKRDYKLKNSDSTINIFATEVQEIIQVKQKNAKLLLFVLLVHSKKYSDRNFVFYMTIEQMVEATGLSIRTCQNQMKNLEDQKVVEVVERKIVDSKKYYKPNKYKLLLQKPSKVSEDYITFDFFNIEESRRKQFIRGIDLLDKNILKDYLSKNDYYSYLKGNYIIKKI